MLGLAFCSSIIQLESAGAELSVRRTLRVLLNSSNTANVFRCVVHVPGNGLTYLSCQLSTVSYTLEPHASCQPQISNRNKPCKAQGMCWSQKDKHMLLVSPDTHFLVLENCLDVQTWRLTELGYTQQRKKILHIFSLIFFLMNGCSNPERAKY